MSPHILLALLLFFLSLLSEARIRSHKKALQAQWTACKGKNMQKLENQFQEQISLSQTEGGALCLEGCLEAEGKNSSVQNGLVNLDQTLQELSSGKEKSSLNLKESFKKKLRKRVKGQIQAKLAESQRLRACLKGKEGDRSWFQKNIPQVDWALMKEVCKKNKKSLQASLQKHWPGDAKTSCPFTG